MIYIRKLLDQDQLSQIQSMMDGGLWIAGIESTEHNNLSLKNNLEYCGSNENIVEVSKIIFDALDHDYPFLGKVAAKSTRVPIYSRTDVGGFYRPHQDAPETGHYSTTVFLNSPEEYDGGCLRIYDHEISEHKLDAGYAITYNTGLIHEVSEVTRGRRDVSVFWTHSKFPPDYRADIYSHLHKLHTQLLKNGRPSSIEEAIEHPGFMAETILTNFKRMIKTDW
jgi:PKHD-type hydroxylase